MARQLGYATAAILRAITQERNYGLDIIAATGLPSGTVYVTLGRLQKRGFVSTAWEEDAIAEADGRPRRRYYALTRDGRDALDQALAAFDALAVSDGHSERQG
jgi:DNA-binding PadR family transcriptional regulator